MRVSPACPHRTKTAPTHRRRPLPHAQTLPPLKTPQIVSTTSMVYKVANDMARIHEDIIDLVRTLKQEVSEMRMENEYLDRLSDTLHRRYVEATLQLHQREDTIAFLHGSLANCEMKLSEAADALRREPSTTMETCMCCYKEVAVTDALRCDAEDQHAFCKDCLAVLALHEKVLNCAKYKSNEQLKYKFIPLHNLSLQITDNYP